MIPIYRILEVSLCSLLSFLPFLLISLYPFRKQLRFSLPVISGLVVLISLLQIILVNWLVLVSSAESGCWTLLCIGIHAAFYFTAVKDRFGKLLAMFLALTNVAVFVAVFSKCLEGLLFGSLALESCRWSLCVCMIIGHLVITVPVWLYISKQYVKVVHIQTSAWGYLWIIPATFCLIWYYHLYLTGQSTLQVVLNVKSTLFLVFINLGEFVIYHTGVLQLMEQEKARTLAQQNQLLALNKLQHNSLQSRINEARQAKHDVRHHTHLIREYLRSGKLQELEEYLDNYSASLPDSQSLIYCQHYATNTLLGYFVQQAKSSNIDIDVFVLLPETLKLPETTISVVLGNLLENAVEACREITEGERKIAVRGKADMGSVFFEVTNTYHGSLRRSKSGKILSSKSVSRGLGLDSVARLAQAHGGMLETDVQDGMFRVSVLLTEETDQV